MLLLRPAIIDLDLEAPDAGGPGRTYRFASSAGAATLFLELYDSVSGESLARVIDRKGARESGDVMRFSDRGDESGRGATDSRRLGELLRDRLDQLHDGP